MRRSHARNKQGRLSILRRRMKRAQLRFSSSKLSLFETLMAKAVSYSPPSQSTKAICEKIGSRDTLCVDSGLNSNLRAFAFLLFSSIFESKTASQQNSIGTIAVQLLAQLQHSRISLGPHPYSARFQTADVLEMIASMLIKIDELIAESLPVFEVLQVYPIYLELMAHFLRCVLVSRGFEGAQNLSRPLATMEVYARLADLFNVTCFVKDSSLFMFPDLSIFVHKDEHEKYSFGHYSNFPEGRRFPHSREQENSKLLHETNFGGEVTQRSKKSNIFVCPVPNVNLRQVPAEKFRTIWSPKSTFKLNHKNSPYQPSEIHLPFDQLLHFKASPKEKSSHKGSSCGNSAKLREGGALSLSSDKSLSLRGRKLESQFISSQILGEQRNDEKGLTKFGSQKTLKAPNLKTSNLPTARFPRRNNHKQKNRKQEDLPRSRTGYLNLNSGVFTIALQDNRQERRNYSQEQEPHSCSPDQLEVSFKKRSDQNLRTCRKSMRPAELRHKTNNGLPFSSPSLISIKQKKFSKNGKKDSLEKAEASELSCDKKKTNGKWKIPEFLRRRKGSPSKLGEKCASKLGSSAEGRQKAGQLHSPVVSTYYTSSKLRAYLQRPSMTSINDCGSEEKSKSYSRSKGRQKQQKIYSQTTFMPFDRQRNSRPSIGFHQRI